MPQLSLDGASPRYVTTSVGRAILSAGKADDHASPIRTDHFLIAFTANGWALLQIDVDVVAGGLAINPDLGRGRWLGARTGPRDPASARLKNNRRVNVISLLGAI